VLGGIVVVLGTAAVGGAQPEGRSGAATTAHITYKDGIRYTNGLANIRIEITPSLSSMAIFVAAKNRIFQAEGLSPTVTVLSNPALSNTLLLSGQYDLNLSSAQAVINTAGGGADVKIVAPGELAATGAADDWTKLWTLKSTGITKVSQLAGKKIGFNALGFYTQFMVNKLVEQSGVSLKDVSMVQVPWATQVAALQSGQIQAADMSEPWLSQAKAQLGSQMVIIANPDYQVAGKKTPVPVGVWEVTGDYARAHPDILAKLRKVAARANAYVNAHPAYAKKVIGQNLHLDASVVQKMITPTYAKTFPLAGFNLLGRLALEYGAIKSLPDNSKILCLTTAPCK
jgi:NitT/TauT family transport system substrate-binding protein